MSISIEEVRHVARLARLELDEAEIFALQGELNTLLGHFADIDSIEMSEATPVSHAVALQNVWSQDTVNRCLSRQDALRNAPMTRAGLFVVPTIIED